MKQEYIYGADQKQKWWGCGEWVQEPDLITFKHAGFDCEIVRVVVYKEPVLQFAKEFQMFGGYLCGYIFIPLDHPWKEKKYDEIEANVHGGITYFERKYETWKVGFDCAHSHDILPSMISIMNEIKEEVIKLVEFINIYHKLKESPVFKQEYRNIDYVIKECKSLADQAKEAYILT